MKSELDETRRGNKYLGNQRQFKYEILDYANPKNDMVCFDAEIEAKINNNTSILDKILNNQRSSIEKSRLGYYKTGEKVCDRKYISDTI